MDHDLLHRRDDLSRDNQLRRQLDEATQVAGGWARWCGWLDGDLPLAQASARMADGCGEAGIERSQLFGCNGNGTAVVASEGATVVVEGRSGERSRAGSMPAAGRRN
jgi:hypothetical protein